jgi:ribosomal protein S18 acetylase RimI-like enzyme
MKPDDAITTVTLGPNEVLRIRPALPNDVVRVEQLHRQGIAEQAFPAVDFEPPKPKMGSGLEPDERSEGYWIAELETSKPLATTIVGTITLRPLDDHVVEARRLYVDPGSRGRGIGLRLLEQLVETCREMGYLKVVLDVGHGSTQAVGLFGRLGFQLAREREIDGRTLLDFYLDIYRDKSR